MKKIQGFATPEGTARFRSRFLDQFHEDAFTQKRGLWFSTVGMGSYLGEPDESTDRLYLEAAKEAVRRGVNVLDTAINYRCQRSEKSFGRAIRQLCEEGEIRRDELILCTKGGFFPFEDNYPQDAASYFKKTYLDAGILKAGDIAQGCHAMSPSYLESQLEKSRSNLDVETVDVYYLHNPETQLEDFDRGIFLDRMREAFAWLEKKVEEGKIRMYGTATWNGYRTDPQAGESLSLEELLILAREAGGPEHHFRALQLPVNLAMPEAWIYANQRYGANFIPLLTLAAHHQLAVVGSAALLQAKLAGKLPDFLTPFFKGLDKSSQRAIQFARSLPGMTAALVGMKQVEHVRENLGVLKVPKLTEQDLVLMFQKQ